MINEENFIQYKEYYNDNYYLKIGINKNNNIIIRCYKSDILNNICYQKCLDIIEIKQINKIFLSFETINEIYNLILKVLNNNSYKIEYINDIIIINIINPNIDNIQITLDKIYNYDIFEYNKLLVNNINKLKNEINQILYFNKNKNDNNYEYSNDINNNNIFSEINYLKEEIKTIKKDLSNSIKENNLNKKEISELKYKLSNIITNKKEEIITEKQIQKNKIKNKEEIVDNNDRINDFKIYKPKNEKIKEKKEENISLQEFNKIFKVNIRKNDNVTELKLGYKNIGINKVKYLSLIDFSNLEQLWLSNNNIIDINILEKVNYPKLQTLDLSNNNISNIDVLENVSFNNLSYLWINNNLINDVSVFSKVKFKKLLQLNLKNNKIKNINVFEKFHLIFLQVLDLSMNKIDIDIPKNKDICDNLRSKIKYFNI